MASPASVEGRPLHPMLVVFPISLFIFSVIAEFWFRGSNNWAWYKTAWYTMGAGLIGAVAAVLPGLIDYASIRRANVKRTATWHMTLNLIIVALFVISFFVRAPQARVAVAPGEPLPAVSNAAFVLSLIGVGMLLVSGWLGGSIVYVHGMAVDPSELCAPGREMYGARPAAAPAD